MDERIGICFFQQKRKNLLSHFGKDSTTSIFLYFSVQGIWIIKDFKSLSAIIVKILISALGSFLSSCWIKSLKTSKAPPGNNQQCTAAIFIISNFNNQIHYTSINLQLIFARKSAYLI